MNYNYMEIIMGDPVFNRRYRLCRCLRIPTKGALARPTGNQYLSVRKSVSSGADFRVLSPLAQNPQILRDRLTHSCVSRGLLPLPPPYPLGGVPHRVDAVVVAVGIAVQDLSFPRPLVFIPAELSGGVRASGRVDDDGPQSL